MFLQTLTMLLCALSRKKSERWQLITAGTFAYSLGLGTASAAGTLQHLLAGFYQNTGTTS